MLTRFTAACNLVNTWVTVWLSAPVGRRTTNEGTTTMTINTSTIERIIVRRLVRNVLDSGRSITVSLERGYDLDDQLAVGSTDQALIMAEAFAGDEAHLFVHDAGQQPVVDGELNALGWVFIVLGNEGWDVISDYTTNLEGLGLLAGLDELADDYADRVQA